MFPVGSRSRNRGRGFAFNRGAKIPPSFVFDFLRGSLDSRITYTGSNGTLFNSSGTLTAATTNVPRLDYNPATLVARGLLIEEARTNSIRNNTMQGASAGTPGTLPTNWQTAGAGLGTLTQTVVGTGTANGISYIDIRLNGTTSTVSMGYRWESNTQIAASNGQTWANSFFVSLVGGATTNITTVASYIEERTAAGVFVTSDNGSNLVSSLTSTLTRVSYVRTLSGGGTVAVVNGGIILLFSSGVAIDITLRIGMPQLELGAFATSVISTSSAAVNRTADVDSSTALIPSSSGTVVISAITSGGSGTQTLWSVDDGTVNNRIYIERNSSNEIHAIVVNGGATQADLNLGTVANNTAFKVAFGFSANSFAASLNGAATVTDTSGTIPTVTTRHIGLNYTNANQWNGWIGSDSEYPTRLPDSTLRALSV